MFKSLLCQLRNNTETTLHVNHYKFHKPGKQRNKTKIDWRIDPYDLQETWRLFNEDYTVHKPLFLEKLRCIHNMKLLEVDCLHQYTVTSLYRLDRNKKFARHFCVS